MDTVIFLVRVRQRVLGSLYLERKDSTTNDDYIAISHVWGDPNTIEKTAVDGFPHEVFLSPGKKDILSILHRPDVCGDSWLWMDLFCIDQTEAKISIAAQLMSIPTVYKSSRCVKVLIESPVCEVWLDKARKVYEVGTVDKEVFGEEELAHGRKCPNLLFRDPWFDRLWTRQEGLYAYILDVVALNPVPSTTSSPTTASPVLKTPCSHCTSTSRISAASPCSHIMATPDPPQATYPFRRHGEADV